MPRTVPASETEVRDPVRFDEDVIGWASMADLWLEGTTGGLGGELLYHQVVVDDEAHYAQRQGCL